MPFLTRKSTSGLLTRLFSRNRFQVVLVAVLNNDVPFRVAVAQVVGSFSVLIKEILADATDLLLLNFKCFFYFGQAVLLEPVACDQLRLIHDGLYTGSQLGYLVSRSCHE